MRVALYARYSTDLQNPRSVDDQIRESKEHCQRRGWTVVATYTDPEISGSTVILRPGVQALMGAAARREFDIVLVEALDRFSRNLGDTAKLREHLVFYQVALHTLGGEQSLMHVAFDGARNEMFIEDLRVKIRRGQRGSVIEGFIPGGLAFGYRVVRKFDDKGEPIRGLREIDPEKAEVVLRIFQEYVGGRSSIEIVTRLNADGIPSPSGATWNVSTMMGSRKRKNGIIQNEIYIGRYLYNRQRMVKNPATGKRLGRSNAVDALTVAGMPHLRIVPQELWDAAQRRLSTQQGHGPREAFTRKPKHLLSGLLKCGCCGGAYTVICGPKLGCSNNHNSGTCDNSRTIQVDKVQRAVLSTIRAELADEEGAEIFIKRFHESERRRAEARKIAARDFDRKLAELRTKQRSLLEAIEAGGRSAGLLVQRLADLEAEEHNLIARMKAKAPEPIKIVPNVRLLFAKKLDELDQGLGARDEDTRWRASQALRMIVTRVALTPLPVRGQFEIESQFDGLGLLRFVVSSGGDSARGTVRMVAEEGFSSDRTWTRKKRVAGRD